MRFLIRMLVLLAVLFCGWWALASYGVSQAITRFVEDRRAAGWQAEAQTAQGGFPFAIRTDVTRLQLQDPGGANAVQASGGTVAARTYWPGHVDVTLPQGPVEITQGALRTTIEAQQGRLALRLRPGFDLQLGRVALDTDGWRIQIEQADILSGDALRLHADQDSQMRARYSLDLQAERLTPGALPRQLLRLPADWPQAFETLTAQGAVTFDAPLTPRSFEDVPPQFRQITLSQMTVLWGGISLSGSGALDVDAAGVPEGQMRLQVNDWRGLLDLAQQSGALPPRSRGQVELMLGLLAARGSDPQNLDLDVQFQGGQMALSGIPLGPAPRLILAPLR